MFWKHSAAHHRCFALRTIHGYQTNPVIAISHTSTYSHTHRQARSKWYITVFRQLFYTTRPFHIYKINLDGNGLEEVITRTADAQSTTVHHNKKIICWVQQGKRHGITVNDIAYMWIYLILKDAKGNMKICERLACTSLLAVYTSALM